MYGSRLITWSPHGVAGIMLLAIVLGLVPIHAAHAALWVEITVGPDPPRAGTVTTVHVQTLVVSGGRCLDDPGVTPTPVAAYTADDWYHLETFAVTATAPDGGEYVILLQRDERDASLWTGTFTFTLPGEWALEMAMPYFPYIPVPDPCTGGSVIVDVLPMRCPKGLEITASSNEHAIDNHGHQGKATRST